MAAKVVAIQVYATNLQGLLRMEFVKEQLETCVERIRIALQEAFHRVLRNAILYLTAILMPIVRAVTAVGRCVDLIEMMAIPFMILRILVFELINVWAWLDLELKQPGVFARRTVNALAIAT